MPKLPQNAINTTISTSLLRIRIKSPFFATLSLFARLLPTQQLPAMATDGKDIFFNANFLRSLPAAQQDGVILHEVLHAALLHVSRRGDRQPDLWNIAADIVVNGMIAQQGCFELPPDAVRNQTLETLSVEEVYELLLQRSPLPLRQRDLLNAPPSDCQDWGDRQSYEDNSEGPDAPDSNEANASNTGVNNAPQTADRQAQEPVQTPSADPSSKNTASGKPNDSGPTQDSNASQLGGHLATARQAELETYWRSAMQQAKVITKTSQPGTLPLGFDRELEALDSAKLDWRSYLWRYLVQTPTDFMGFDRRFIGRGLYLEALEGESVRVYVAVDTSGSISPKQLSAFLSEVNGILSVYPHLQCELYFADAALYGPYALDPDAPLPAPKGGGGTSFIPFFQAIETEWDGLGTGVCIYLTDGYGSFPEQVPSLDVLWVVTPGGLALEQFPFGEAVRLVQTK